MNGIGPHPLKTKMNSLKTFTIFDKYQPKDDN